MTAEKGRPLNIVLFGTADLENPRTRILIEGLKSQGDIVLLCHSDIWHDQADRSAPGNRWRPVLLMFRWLSTMLCLSWKYLLMPKHDIVLVCYPGHIDLWVARLLTLIRGKMLCWDAFISAYDTLVGDRKLVTETSLLARASYALDWCACRLADHIFLDTAAHAAFFEASFRLKKGTIATVPVGAENRFFSTDTAPAAPAANFSIVFFGKFIPLHGIPTILEAAKTLKDESISFTLVGDGQTASATRAWLQANPLSNLEWLPWVDYRSLPIFLKSFQLGLGIFSAGDKASRVVPNKIYQMLAVGLPVITRISPAIEELAEKSDQSIRLVPAQDAHALASAIQTAKNDWENERLSQPGPHLLCGPKEVGKVAHNIFNEWINGTH